MWRCILAAMILLGVAIPIDAPAAESQLPPFLPEYYAPAFQIGDALLLPTGSNEANGVEQFNCSTEDRGFQLSVERIRCDRTRCLALFDKLQGYLSNKVKGKDGTVLELTRSELSARIQEPVGERSLFAYILPGSILFWTYSAAAKEPTRMMSMFNTIKSFANRQRYDQSFPDNVDMGFWGPQVHEYSRQLMREGKKREALQVLRRLVATSPSNFDAHMDLIEMTDDPKEAKSSARTVFKNSENPQLIAKAAKQLGLQKPGMDSVPILSSGEKGLQLILVPLPPCNVQFLQDAAVIYERMTKIPVKTRRLRTDWSLRGADRIFRQRDVQGFLTQETEGQVDFRGWDKNKYIEALREAAESKDPVTGYHIRVLIDSIEKEQGQYDVGSYLGWFCSELKKYRSDDLRTMYVGVSEVNIYEGDNNFIFSLHENAPGMQASILSYNMMLAKTLSDEYESRPRLAERIAKELVPASLKTLGIPRSTDPKCPYSYSSGVERLDQKGLVLSGQVEKGLKRFR